MEAKLTVPPTSTSVDSSEVLNKIVELKNVFELNSRVNSNLMKKREEEIEALKEKLEAYKKTIASTQDELEESKNSLQHELKMKTKYKVLYRESKKQLEIAKKTIEEKSTEITEMEEYILLIEVRRENEENLENISYEDILNNSLDGLTELFVSPSAVDSKLTLSPIPEENIEEIPDYYDEWWEEKEIETKDSWSTFWFYRNAYKSSLQISIGSDSKISENLFSESEIADVNQEVSFEAIVADEPNQKMCKMKSFLSDVSDKENVKKLKKKKKKKKRFTTLFSLAHF